MRNYFPRKSLLRSLKIQIPYGQFSSMVQEISKFLHINGHYLYLNILSGWFGKETLRPFDECMDEFKTPARKTALFTEAMKQAQDPSLLAEIEAVEIAKVSKKTGKAAANDMETDEEDGEEIEEPVKSTKKTTANKRKPAARLARETVSQKKSASAHNGQPKPRKGSSLSKAGADTDALIHELIKTVSLFTKMLL